MSSFRFLTYILAIILASVQCSCNSQSVAGVYSGVEVSISPMMGGGGLDRKDVTLYLRPDKTFTTDVRQQGWKTDVMGKWSVKDKKVVLTYNDAEKSSKQYTILDHGGLKTSGGYVLVKMELANSVPEGAYQYTYASGSGGIGTAVPYVGAHGSRYIYFDGKGNFGQAGNSGVSVIGENIGGGTSRKDSSSGTYTIKEGELVMFFPDGNKTTHSLFVSRNKEKGAMLFLDGKAFFQRDEKEKGKVEKEMPSAEEFLTKVRNTHGGAGLDRIKTIRAELTASGLDIVSITDLERGWTRTEIWQDGKLLVVDQLEGNSGWQWQKGTRSSLPADRVSEMQTGLHMSFGGLSKDRMQLKLKEGTVEQNRSGYELVYHVDDTEIRLIADENFQLQGQQKKNRSKILIIEYDDYRQLEGMKIPFVEKHREGETILNAKITEFAINKTTEADWAPVK